MRGLAPSIEPSIEWGVSGVGKILSGCVHRLERGTCWWHVVPVAVGLGTTTAALSGQTRCSTVELHPDHDLDVTLLHIATPVGDDPASERAVDALIGAAAIVGIADLEERLGADRSVACRTDDKGVPSSRHHSR